MLAQMLKLQPGITTVIGSGGKTTLLYCLGRELQTAGYRVVLGTTTKIYPFPGIPLVTEPSLEQIRQALDAHGLVCAGRQLPELGKLTAPEVPMEELVQLADFVLVEGDGSARRPLKAHLPHEPVIPPLSGRTICVVGLSGLGRRIQDAVHRPERFCALSGLYPEDAVTAEAAAKVLNAEKLADCYLLNQLDAADKTAAENLLRLLDRNAIAISLAPPHL